MGFSYHPKLGFCFYFFFYRYNDESIIQVPETTLHSSKYELQVIYVSDYIVKYIVKVSNFHFPGFIPMKCD